MMVDSLLPLKRCLNLFTNKGNPILRSYDRIQTISVNCLKFEIRNSTIQKLSDEEQQIKSKLMKNLVFFTGCSLSTRSSSSSLSCNVGNLRLRSANLSSFSHTACAC